ncbi:MAG: hypothetical protein M1828_007203 [Chrysothrix sp. TS-e1954]|nr:MAG: hypothetical protein M1828_007203 [Chrysothrix sp. TS-e1954]
MAERPSKRTKRESTEDSEGTEDWEEDALRMNARPGTYQPIQNNTRRGRKLSPSVERSPSMSSDAPPKRSIRLNIRPPSRLQELKDDGSDDDSGTGSRVTRETLSRNSKNKKPVVDEPSTEEEDSELSSELQDDEEEIEVEQEEEGAGGDGEQDEDEEEEEQEEEEDEQEQEEEDEEEEPDQDTDSDIEMGGTPTLTPDPPQIKVSAPQKPSPERVLKTEGRAVQSVEEREAANPDIGADEEMDDELDDEDEDLEEFEGDMDDRADIITADAIGEDELDTDDSGTPDPTKMTRRQRRTSPSTLLALSNEAQKKKFFTAEQITVRRAEMARRRKDLSEKRNEEEKKDTLKRLLEKPAAPKRRNKAQMMADAEREEFGTPSRMTEGDGAVEVKKGYIRTLINARGTRVGVPKEWLGKEVGRIFEGARKNTTGGFSHPGRMVEVVE